jgi:hypothetical protein
MRKFAVVIALTLSFPAIVWALGSDHPKQPVNNDKWPKGMAELVNADNRVHGYFVNFEDVFFFKGDTDALNDFLAKYAQLLGAKLHVVIHGGRLDVRSPWDKQSRDIEADWQLYATPFTRDQVQAGAVKPGPFVTRVDVWLGGSINLDELRVPEIISVDSGGEIEAFVKKHGVAK